MSAILSPDGLYRYELRRDIAGIFSPTPLFVVIGLNPSTADATEDDPTIRRCVGFARREGCGELVMLNLYALRATDPDALIDTIAHPNMRPEYAIRWAAVGPDNDDTIAAVVREVREHGGIIVAAWGSTHARLTEDRVAAVMDALCLCTEEATAQDPHDARCPVPHVRCLGTTKDGHPRHPLYLRADAPLVPWSPR